MLTSRLCVQVTETGFSKIGQLSTYYGVTMKHISLIIFGKVGFTITVNYNQQLTANIE